MGRKQLYDIRSAQFGHCKHQQRCCRDKAHTKPEELSLLNTIPAAMEKSNDRCCPHGKAEQQSIQQELGIYEDRNRCNTVFPQQPHHRAVKQEGRNSRRHLPDHFRGAIEAAFFQYPPSFPGPYKRKHAPAAGKKDDPGYSRNEAAAARPECCPANTKIEDDNKYIVQNNICEACQNGQPKPQSRLSGSDKQIGKNGLQDVGRDK